MASFLALLGVFLIGLSKAGFATGLGMLSTPLMAQALPARTAIGVIPGVFFTVNNLLKVPPYVATGLIDAGTLALSLRYAAAVPFGIAAGWWANRYLPQRHFDAVVAVLMIATSLHLLLGG
jgi:uncharacterized protein